MISSRSRHCSTGRSPSRTPSGIAFADWAGVRWHDDPSAALADRAMPGARWFPGGTLNYSEHALAGIGDAIAIVSLSQTRDRTTLTYDELPNRSAAAPRGCGGSVSSPAIASSA